MDETAVNIISKRATLRAVCLNRLNNRSNANGNRNLDSNNARLVGIVLASTGLLDDMDHETDLFSKICSYENLELAFRKARKHKTKKLYVIEFEKNLKENLLKLQAELLLFAYMPKPLKTFILRDPKTRKISKSNFRDRVVQHALCAIIEPIFDKTFIYDSYANRKGKGSLKALQRFDSFKRKVSKNNTRNYYVLKADVKHYFEEVNHLVLLDLIKRKIKDSRVILLIKNILANFDENKGMPLGNLTSQFFANIYLNKLDQFVKHRLKAKYYIRYVDDFVVLHSNKNILNVFKDKISNFLKDELLLELHPNKCRIISNKQRVGFLGFRVFYYHKLLRKMNIKNFDRKLEKYIQLYNSKDIDYDCVYDFVTGWMSYANHGNTYNLRKKVSKKIEKHFSGEISSIEIRKLIKFYNQTTSAQQRL